MHCGMKGDVTIVRLNRRLKDDVIVLPRKMMELFNLVLEGADVVEGELAARVGIETLNTLPNRNPSESAGEAQVGETSKQINLDPSESRASSMSRGLKGNVAIAAGEPQGGETSKRNRNASGRNVKSIVQFYERCSSGSKATNVQGEQGFGSTMELVRRSPRHKRSVPGVQQHPHLMLTSDTLVDAAAKSAAPTTDEATSTSKTTKGGGEQDFHSTVELVRRSPSQKPTVPGVQQHPDHLSPPTSGILVEVASKSAAPPPDEATSKRTKGEGEQDFYSTMEIVRRSTRQKPSVPGVKQHTDLTRPTSGRIFVEIAAKSAAPPPDEEATSDASAEDIQPGNRRVRRKISPSVHKEIIQAVDGHKETTQAVENASKVLAESIDRIHSTKLQIAENKVKSQEHLFNTELDYMKKRDRQINRNKKKLISAINGLTKIIMTGLKDTARAGAGIQPENARGGDINTQATSQDTLQPVEQQAADAQE